MTFEEAREEFLYRIGTIAFADRKDRTKLNYWGKRIDLNDAIIKQFKMLKEGDILFEEDRLSLVKFNYYEQEVKFDLLKQLHILRKKLVFLQNNFLIKNNIQIEISPPSIDYVINYCNSMRVFEYMIDTFKFNDRGEIYYDYKEDKAKLCTLYTIKVSYNPFSNLEESLGFGQDIYDRVLFFCQGNNIPVLPGKDIFISNSGEININVSMPFIAHNIEEVGLSELNIGKKYNKNLLTYYMQAFESKMVSIKFLHYYNVLEYFFGSVLEDELKEEHINDITKKQKGNLKGRERLKKY